MTPITWYLYGRSGGAKKAAEEIGVKESVSGDVASFSDGCAGMPMKSIVAEITPVQSGSGDPSPTNVRPISGRTGMTVTRAGKNLLPSHAVGSTTVYGVTFDVREDGSIRAHGTATQQADFPIVGQNNLTLDAGTYTVKRTPADNIQYIIGGGSNTSGLAYTVVTKDNDATFTISNSGTTGHNILRVLSRATVDAVYYPQIEVGSIATDYTPYAVQTYPITWESIAGTVYGGTLDVVSGVLTVTHKSVTYTGADDEAWAYGSQRFTRPLPDDSEKTNARYEVRCNIGKYIPTGSAEFGIFGYGGAVYYYPDGITTVPAFKEWLANNNMQVVYPLETPQTYQLTPTEVRTILGGNNIYTDAGDVSVEYIADTKLYIDNKVAELQALVLEN